MARARYIKPGFFTNERVGELDPLDRILWQGLWCHADREGRLKDIRRRLNAKEERMTGPAVDVRGTPEFSRRLALVRYHYPWAPAQ